MDGSASKPEQEKPNAFMRAVAMLALPVTMLVSQANAAFRAPAPNVSAPVAITTPDAINGANYIAPAKTLPTVDTPKWQENAKVVDVLTAPVKPSRDADIQRVGAANTDTRAKIATDGQTKASTVDASFQGTQAGRELDNLQKGQARVDDTNNAAKAWRVESQVTASTGDRSLTEINDKYLTLDLKTTEVQKGVTDGLLQRAQQQKSEMTTPKTAPALPASPVAVPAGVDAFADAPQRIAVPSPTKTEALAAELAAAPVKAATPIAAAQPAGFTHAMGMAAAAEAPAVDARNQNYGNSLATVPVAQRSLEMSSAPAFTPIRFDTPLAAGMTSGIPGISDAMMQTKASAAAQASAKPVAAVEKAQPTVNEGSLTARLLTKVTGDPYGMLPMAGATQGKKSAVDVSDNRAGAQAISNAGAITLSLERKGESVSFKLAQANQSTMANQGSMVWASNAPQASNQAPSPRRNMPHGASLSTNGGGGRA